MKIKVTECFAHKSGAYIAGREYDVSDAFAAELVGGNLAHVVVEKPEDKPEDKPEKKKPEAK